MPSTKKANRLLKLKEQVREMEDMENRLSGQIEMIEGELKKIYKTSDIKGIEKELRKKKNLLKRKKREREQKLTEIESWIEKNRAGTD